MDYQQFLHEKTRRAIPAGFSPLDTIDALFPFQVAIVEWAVRKGRAAIFAECGLGKTLMQLEWARQVSEHTSGPVLILTPLAVAQQTAREADHFGFDVKVCATQDDIGGGINLTNYEKLHHFDTAAFAGVVLDESSILKSFDGKTRQAIVEGFSSTPYRLACTATPSPNDYMELGNHAEFLGVMRYSEMLAMYFIHDGGKTSQWRLKGHAEDPFWQWVSTWGVMIKNPSDLGPDYEMSGFDLPVLHISPVELAIEQNAIEERGALFALPELTLNGQRRARRESMNERVAACMELAGESADPWLIWCELNTEADAVTAAIKDAVQVKGADSAEDKIDRLVGFAEGKYRVLVTKPSIAGFGMNWQHCANMIFVGATHSYEQFYQAVRRCWRFGQKRDVNVYILSTEEDVAIVRNLKDKQNIASQMEEAMTRFAQTMLDKEDDGTSGIAENDGAVHSGEGWTLYNGDCIEVAKARIDDASIDFSVFSPPFADLYTYSDSVNDMGNSTRDEFLHHMGYLVNELMRVTKDGRLVSFHCMNLPVHKWKEGFVGLYDFRGDLIRMFIDAGFIYHSEVTIWKDPVTAMQRTKAIGLLYKQIKKDAAMSRQGIPDYLVTMRKPGDNPQPIAHDPDDLPLSMWQNYASPVWDDIDPSDTLQYRAAKDSADERHICPLQLGVIRRAVHLWSNPGDLVLSPFAGIGSEGYVALDMGRRFVGIELKRSYWEQAAKNLRSISERTIPLFDISTREPKGCDLPGILPGPSDSGGKVVPFGLFLFGPS